MYICKYFQIYELIDKLTYERFGQQAWMFFNPQALMFLDGIREFFSTTVIVNNWYWGGKFQFRGLRPKYCTVGAEYSQHRLGNAFDCDIKNISAEEARQIILKNKNDKRLKYITCIEDKINWLHADCRNISNRILLFKP